MRERHGPAWARPTSIRLLPSGRFGSLAMLDEMRNLYDNARHYDALFPGPKDLPFYQRQIAAHGGPVLELACGTGRLTVPLAAAGVDITGIDRSPSMLEAARDRAARG